MKIHEYQAKAVLARHGVPVPRGEIAFTASEAGDVARRLGDGPVVVKAQIHAGGRGKGGGVKVAKSAGEAESLAQQILGMRLVTAQTGPDGRIVTRVLIEEGVSIKREIYLGLVLDRAEERLVLMTSPAGGVDIEKVAEQTPHLISRSTFTPPPGWHDTSFAISASRWHSTGRRWES
jgi:succinyl-CoA synthetase beta subunit